MRNSVINEVDKLAALDERICLITADLGYGVLDTFATNYPKRFFNIGISEQSMTSVAAGMALDGQVVFTYSIGNFPTLRCLEQIRNDVCYHNVNVKIIAVGGGFAYGQLGMSHHATEDIAVMRSLPNMRVIVPADLSEAVAAVREAYSTDGPCYLRLGRGGEENLHDEISIFDIKHAIQIYSGNRVNILVVGSLLAEARKAADILNQQGISTGLYSMPCVKPIDVETIKTIALNSKLIVTMEEHNVLGGFGGAVAEVISGIQGNRAMLVRIGLQDEYTSIVGDQDYLRNYYKMSAEKVVKKVHDLLIEIED